MRWVVVRGKDGRRGGGGGGIDGRRREEVELDLRVLLVRMDLFDEARAEGTDDAGRLYIDGSRRGDCRHRPTRREVGGERREDEEGMQMEAHLLVRGHLPFVGRRLS